MRVHGEDQAEQIAGAWARRRRPARNGHAAPRARSRTARTEKWPVHDAALRAELAGAGLVAEAPDDNLLLVFWPRGQRRLARGAKAGLRSRGSSTEDAVAVQPSEPGSVRPVCRRGRNGVQTLLCGELVQVHADRDEFANRGRLR